MDTTTLNNIMKRLGLSEASLARLLKLGKPETRDNPDEARKTARTVRRWKSGDNDIPGPVEVILTAYAENDGALPPLSDYQHGKPGPKSPSTEE